MSRDELIKYLQSLPEDVVIKAQNEAPEYGAHCGYDVITIDINLYYDEVDNTLEFGGE